MMARSSAAGARRSFSGLIMPHANHPRAKAITIRTLLVPFHCHKSASASERPSGSEATGHQGAKATGQQRASARGTTGDRLVRIDRQLQLIDRHELVRVM